MAVETERPNRENWESFHARLQDFSRKDRKDINFAYRLSKKLHEGQIRLGNKERYFEHPRAVAIILLDECGYKDRDLIITALLHDVIEDTNVITHKENQGYSNWKEEALDNLTRMFSKKAAGMIVALTRPSIDNIEILTKEQAEQVHLKNIEEGGAGTLLVKMADRLHNLRTPRSAEHQEKKIKETKEFYMPLFGKFLFSMQRRYLYNEIDKIVNS